MFIGTTIYSVIVSIGDYGIFYNVFSSIDWIAACVIYFFIGAMIGHIVDYVRNRKIRHPLWFWLIVAFWILSSITLFIFADKTQISTVEIILFPLAYEIFFTGMTFTMILPDAIVKSDYGKLVFDLVFIAAFTFWTYYEYTNKKRLLRRILLLTLFAVLIIGFIGCTAQLA